MMSPSGTPNPGSLIVRYDFQAWQCLLAILLLLLYSFTLPTTITLEDAGLFQMVCQSGGISHPPGYPLFTMICQGLLPQGGVVAGNFLSAAFAVIAVVLFSQIVWLVSESRSVALLAAAFYGVGQAFWSQAIIIEVYSLAVLLFMGSWLLLSLFTRHRDFRYWYAACLTTGLGLSNHWPLMILSGMALPLVLWSVWPLLLAAMKKPKFWLLSCLLLGLGLLPYAQLVLVKEPEIAVYGPVTSWQEFWRYVSRSLYNDNHAVADFSHKVSYLKWLSTEIFSQYVPLVQVFVLLGFIHSWRKITLSANLVMLLVFLSSTYILMAVVNFEYTSLYRAVFKPYPVISYAALAYWAAMGIHFLTELRLFDRKLPAWQPGVFLLLITTASVFPAMNRSRGGFIENYNRTILEFLPPDAVLFVRGDNQTGPIGYLNRVEKLRTDIEVRDLDNLVFSNRLVSPFAPTTLADAALASYVTSEPRRVFSLVDQIRPSTSWGVVYEYTPETGTATVLHPTMVALLDYLMTLYEEDLLWDEHEQYFLYNRMIAFAGFYRSHVSAYGVESLTERQLRQFEKLQRLFPGQMVMLEHLAARALSPTEQADALLVAAAAEQQMPSVIPLRSEAFFYEYYGKIEAQAGQLAAARAHLTRSLALWRLPDNRAVCTLIEVLQQLDETTEAKALANAYEKSQCP
ncbi:MAG: DUF2723 domain-containing protein [Pseudomonadales bacterium]|nr:DUF2723 domain-containing protein [Pseudomonadales bacterium]